MILLDAMSRELRLPQVDIVKLAKSASHHYYHFTIPKRNGGQRQIFHPSKQLKALQRWLKVRVIDSWPVHEAAMAYRPGINIRDNAEKHSGSSYLLRLDFRNFFSSISALDIGTYILERQPVDWNEEEIKLFSMIVCRNFCLTIGAPTSPPLSNCICVELDLLLSAIAESYECTYTRYADDLFFSSDGKGVLGAVESDVGAVLRTLGYPSGLVFNEQKSRHSSKRGRRQVTGLVLTSDGRVSLGRSRKRRVRSMIYRLPLLTPEERLSLSGELAFCFDIEPDFENRLVLKYGYARVKAARVGEPSNRAGNAGRR